MILHTHIGTGTKEPSTEIGARKGLVQDETLVETTAQGLERLIGLAGHKNAHRSLSVDKQYAIAVGSTLGAVLVRFIADSYLGDTLPFVTFLVAIAVTTWYGGVGASLTALAIGALVWNWFFVNPRYAFTMGSHMDQADMTVYLTIGVAIIGYVQTWRWAWRQSEEMAHVFQHERVLERHPNPGPSRMGTPA